MRPGSGAVAIAALLALAAPAPARALTLAEGLAAVARSGRDAAVAEALEALGRSGPEIARAARLPSVDLFARESLLAYRPETDVGLGEPIPIAERDSLAYGVRVRQLLWDFGGTDALVRAAEADAEGQRLEAALARNRAGLRFLLAYLRVLRASGLLAVAREETARHEAHRDDARALLEEGAITGNDLLQAEVRLADAIERRLRSENALALAEAEVNSLLLRPLGQPVNPAPVPPRSGSPAALADALAEAEASRLELAGLRARLAASGARRAAARAESFPRVSVGGAYEFAENRYQVHEGNWSLVAGVDLNVYSGGATRARLARQDRELALLERSLALASDGVALEVRAAFLGRENARARVGAAGAAVAQARENLRLERLRYAEGVGTSTAVLDAVSLAAAAEQNELNARHDEVEAEARLDFATGADLAARWGGGAPAPAPGEERP